MRPRLRARRDYLLFRFKRDWAFLLSLTGLLLGVLSLLAELLPTAVPSLLIAVVTVVGFFVGAVLFGRDRRDHVESTRKLVVAAMSATPAMPELPTTYDGARAMTHPTLGPAIVHDGVDDRLDGANLDVEWLPEPFDLADELRRTAVQVIGERLRGGQIAFNGPVVRLGSDLTPATLQSGRVILQRATYFDGECSNELSHRRLRARGEDEPAIDFTAQYLCDGAGHLRELAQSRLANIVGISTLAFTRDERLVVVTQSLQSGASRQLIAPSGSGSLEPKDVRTHLIDGAACRLRTVLVTGMERELFEECNLPPKTRRATELTGFARWMHRGAKPEFFGLTWLDIESEAIAERGVHRRERAYTQDLRTVRVDFDALRAAGSVDELERLGGAPREIFEHASLPFLLAWRALARRLAADGQTLRRLRDTATHQTGAARPRRTMAP